MSRFLNRFRWAPFTLSAHLTAWGIFLTALGQPATGGLLLLLCGIGGGALVWSDYSTRVGRFRSDMAALFSGEPPTLRELLGLAAHIPQGIIGGFILWQAFG
jgi:hypothetical protein